MPIVVITLDFTAPTVVANPVGGNYQVLTSVLLTANEPATIYWTTDNSIPSIGGPTTFSAASPALVTMPPGQLQVRVKFFAKDLAGNLSVNYEEVYLIKPLNTTVRTRFGPLVKLNQVDTLATISDVVVYVDGVPVTISGIRPLHNEIYLAAPPPAGAEVRVEYCWFDNPSYQMSLNHEDYVLNAVDGYNATDVPYTLVLNETVTDQPAEVTWEYTAFERRYTAALNNPDLLLLNEPIHEVRHPATGRPTHPEFVLNWSNTIFSYEQIKTDALPTVLNDGTPVYPLTQDDEPTYGPTSILSQATFQANPDLWKNYDALVLDGENVYALQKATEEGFYIGLETTATSVGVAGLLAPACDRFTGVSITGLTDTYQPPYQNCGFIYFNPPFFSDSQLNSCFVLHGGDQNQIHSSMVTTDADTVPIHQVVDDGVSLTFAMNDVRTCEDLGFILNEYTVIASSFVPVGSYMNDAAVADDEYIQPGSYLQNPLDCYNDESSITFILVSFGVTTTYQAMPYQSILIEQSFMETEVNEMFLTEAGEGLLTES